MVDKDMQLDHARFENIYRKYFDRVAAYLLARADRDLAADALSRTFKVACVGLPTCPASPCLGCSAWRARSWRICGGARGVRKRL